MNPRMDPATSLRMSVALTDAPALPGALDKRFPFESPFEHRMRILRARSTAELREKLAEMDEAILTRRKRMRQAYDDLPALGYASGPDEYDSLLIDAFDLSVDLLRQAYRERGKVRRELGAL